MSDYIGQHRGEPEFVEDVEDDGWDDDMQYGWADEVSDEDMDALLAPGPEEDLGLSPQDGAAEPVVIPEAIRFAVNALMDHYTYDEIREAVDRLHEARPHLTTAFSVYLTSDGSTLVNTDVPGVSVDREPSTEDMRRAARDVAEFHQHQRIASMVRAAL